MKYYICLLLLISCTATQPSQTPDLSADITFAQSSFTSLTPFLKTIWLEDVVLDTDFDCDTSGSYSISGNLTEDPANQMTGDFTLTFSGCDFIEGSLEITGTSNQDDSSYSNEINGNVITSGCNLIFENLTYDFSADSISNVTGSLTSFCAQSVDFNVISCLWNDDVPDLESFLENCV